MMRRLCRGGALLSIIFSFLFSVSACSDFLEVDVKGKATIPSFLSDPQGLNAGLVGTYNKMYAYVDNEFTKYGDVAGNMVSRNQLSLCRKN